jgi:hypothetical protein
MLNKAGSVAYGNHTMHLKDLLSSVDILFRTKRAGQPINWLEYLTNMNKPNDLYRLLPATESCHCGDLRDRIYGLMGLVTEEEAKRLPIDYNLSVQQLYTGLAMYWLTNDDPRSQSRPLEILERALLPKTTPYLPSWVPDWAPQLPTVRSWEYIRSTSSTFQFDTTHLLKASGLNWPQLPDFLPYDLNGLNAFEIPWESGTIHSLESTHAQSSRPEDSRQRSELFKLLPQSGTLALDAAHILSTSMGKVEISDIHGKLLHGLQVANSGAIGPVKGSSRENDLHLHYLPSCEVAVASKKHSDTVYSLHGSFRIIFAPIDRPIPSSVNDTLDIYIGLVQLEFDIIDRWLMDSFFYGACAGSAYAHTHIRKDWSEHFPLASTICQASNFSFNALDGELHDRSILLVMMAICGDVLDFLDENPVSKESALRKRLPTPNGLIRDCYIPILGDGVLTARVQEALATRKLEASSPQEMCTYLRNVIKGHQDVCKHYAPLQTALSDLSDDDEHQLPKYLAFRQRPRHPIPLLLSKKKIFSLQTAGQTEAPYLITQAFIVWRARSLLSKLTIDPKFTLEQNFNILWIYVLTMEMVARLRGVIQQRLILKAIRDKMMNVKKIHII